jgi:integrase
MLTPEILIGTTNPFTKKPFGKEIKLGLNTRSHADAVRIRDIRIGQIRQLESDAMAAAKQRHVGQIIDLSPESAAAWREARANDASDEGAVDLILSEQIERAAEAGKPEQAQRFADMVYRGAMPLGETLAEYLKERSPGNPFGYDPLSKTTALDVQTSVKHFTKFIGADHPTLRDATPDKVFEFRTVYLPLTAKLSPGTVNKHMTLMRGLWKWAIADKKYLTDRQGRPIKNPWEIDERGTSKRKASRGLAETKREDFAPDQVKALLSGFPSWGTRQGDLMRLMLATGCRIDELGSLHLRHVKADGTSLRIPEGKTENAARFIPLAGDAQKLLHLRHALAIRLQPEIPEEDRRLFPEWPLKPATGKVNSASQWFTRYRRQVLGIETDAKLSAHSFRHTWATIARRADVSENRIKELGGWSKGTDTAQVYNHGLSEEILAQTQEKIWEALGEGGYLNNFTPG